MRLVGELTHRKDEEDGSLEPRERLEEKRLNRDGRSAERKAGFIC
jgi:hypothetical protein|tara:strand:+ start:957 stop:1091 length:135 start_codon:yes stop_codon:yes gene_type:complete